MSTSINYLDEAWNVARGCSPNMSCAPRCWAREDAHIHVGHPNPKVRAHYEGLTDSKGNWTGVVRLDESVLLQPLRWRKPRVVGVAFSGDLFRLPAEQIDRVFAVMSQSPNRTFLLLTKCTEAAAEYLMAEDREDRVDDAGCSLGWCHANAAGRFPLPDLFLGFSASNQSEFDARWPYVAKLAAQGWKTWVSLEPLIGPIDLTNVRFGRESSMYRANALTGDGFDGARLASVVLGGESGKDARPMHPYWVQKVRDDCSAANVPFLFKQWGQCGPLTLDDRHGGAYKADLWVHPDGSTVAPKNPELIRDWAWPMQWMGKKLAGRTLDGRTHDELAWEVGR